MPQRWVIIISTSVATAAVLSICLTPAIGVPSGIALAGLLHRTMD